LDTNATFAGGNHMPLSDNSIMIPTQLNIKFNTRPSMKTWPTVQII